MFRFIFLFCLSAFSVLALADSTVVPVLTPPIRTPVLLLPTSCLAFSSSVSVEPMPTFLSLSFSKALHRSRPRNFPKPVSGVFYPLGFPTNPVYGSYSSGKDGHLVDLVVTNSVPSFSGSGDSEMTWPMEFIHLDIKPDFTGTYRRYASVNVGPGGAIGSLSETDYGTFKPARCPRPVNR